MKYSAKLQMLHKAGSPIKKNFYFQKVTYSEDFFNLSKNYILNK